MNSEHRLKIKDNILTLNDNYQFIRLASSGMVIVKDKQEGYGNGRDRDPFQGIILVFAMRF
jgi:hypothetical protein